MVLLRLNPSLDRQHPLVDVVVLIYLEVRVLRLGFLPFHVREQSLLSPLLLLLLAHDLGLVNALALSLVLEQLVDGLVDAGHLVLLFNFRPGLHDCIFKLHFKVVGSGLLVVQLRV